MDLLPQSSDWTLKVVPLPPSPFTVGRPVLRDEFAGRQDQVADFYRHIRARQSVSVVGIRGSGKTSFLEYVADPSVIGQHVSEGDGLAIVYVDLQHGVRTPSDFYARLASAIRVASGNQGKQEGPESPASTAELSRALDAARGTRFAVLLDEFEVLMGLPGFDEGFFANLRSFVTSHEIAWVPATYHGIYELCRDFGFPAHSPFFNILSRRIFLGSFTEAEARDLIAERASEVNEPFSTADVQWVIVRAGLLPSSVQKCAQALLFAHRSRHDSFDAYAEATAAFKDWADDRYAYCWSKLGPGERIILAASVSPRPIKAKVGSESDRQLLVQYGLARVTSSGLCINGEWFAEWIQQRVELEELPRGVAAQEASISEFEPSATLSGHTHDQRLSSPRREPAVVLITLHGIESRGAWQKQFTPLVSGRFVHYPLDYGRFLAVQLLLGSQRDGKVEWFVREYETIAARHPEARVCVVAHSFGTYILAMALRKYEKVVFDRIVFCGSIVHPAYEWRTRLERGQFSMLLNECGRRDRWVKLVEWFVADAGPSGATGFRDLPSGHTQQRIRPVHRHSDYFHSMIMTEWVDFLEGKPIPDIAGGSESLTNRKHFLVFAVAIVVVVVVLLIYLK